MSKPTEAELEVLQILWKQGPSTVRAIHETINAQKGADEKPTGYTTTLKIMQLMAEKSMLSRDTSSRTHVYHAAMSEPDTQSKLLSRFVETTFRGSAMKLVMQALGNHKASKDELDEIKDLIKNMEDDIENKK